MPMYLYQASYSREAIKALVAKPQDREAAARKLIEGVGGKLHQMYFSFGSYDIVALIEAPDDKTMVAAAMAVGASGTVSSGATTKLFTAGEAQEAMGAAGRGLASYASPMG